MRIAPQSQCGWLLDEDLLGLLRRAASAQEIDGQVQVDVGKVREPLSRGIRIAGAREGVPPPAPYELRFGVYLDFEFSRRQVSSFR